jgi:cell division transport system ATP-binding protein
MDHRAIVTVKELTLFYGFQPVLQDVTFDINRGEFIFLTGETGSGKSSLLKTLYADLPLKSGEVHIAGFDLGSIKSAQLPFLRRKLGIVFQDFQLLMDRNIAENLLFVLRAMGRQDKSAMRKKVEEVLMQVGLGWASKKMLHQLSGGEQQRIAIARALLNDPLILLADEPTGNLDPGVAHDILALFLEINRGGTAVLMATHNYDLVEKNPTRVLRCQKGDLLDFPKTAAVL